VSVDIPLGKWVCVSGVSGSGKTTLVHNVLYQGFNQYAKRAVEDLGACESIRGLEQLDEVCLIDQCPIGRSSRSNPVTYVKAYDPIRKLMASTREARSLGITESAFSFNVQGGRCEACEGTGVTTYDMHFLAEVTLPCEVCNGKRFSPRVLEVKYKGKNIDDILGMTVDDATEFFQEHTTAIRRLAPLREVGLGYLTLGQNTSTISGGEAQRLKLASHLSGSTAAGPRTMMIFDEPTTGLHLADLHVLAGVFRRLVSLGYSLVIIEHNLEIIREADWVIDLGPEAGDEGGLLVAAGPPAHLAGNEASHTGRFLREVM
jgi:excinuclease ABC subunit A